MKIKSPVKEGGNTTVICLLTHLGIKIVDDPSCK